MGDAIGERCTVVQSGFVKRAGVPHHRSACMCRCGRLTCALFRPEALKAYWAGAKDVHPLSRAALDAYVLASVPSVQEVVGVAAAGSAVTACKLLSFGTGGGGGGSAAPPLKRSRHFVMPAVECAPCVCGCEGCPCGCGGCVYSWIKSE